jgi:hypothetical protein
MYYRFPNQDTLQLALTTGIVPPTVSLQSATVGIDSQGRPWAQVTNAPKAMQTGLKRLGVEALSQAPSAGRAASCWFELLPPVRSRTLPETTNQIPVLFWLQRPESLVVLVGEMLRLGNDRQSYRWLTDAKGQTSVLLRVIGPPYYTLLRALEGTFDIGGLGQSLPVRAFVEQAARVWVELGFEHPMADKLQLAENNLLLIEAGGQWVWLDNAPFADIYDILHFELAHEQTNWQANTHLDKLIVPLRLVAGGASDVAEMWVLRDEPMAQLDQLVRDLPDRVLGQLAFAVGELDGQTIIVLRTRPGPAARTELVLRGIRYLPYSRIPNLYVPVGYQLQPLLRRDVLMQMLAPDPAQIVWLHPTGGTAFVPESLPDSAFQPLSEWVNYVIDQQRVALREWVQSTEFDFDSYLCKDDEPPSEPKPPSKSASRPTGNKKTRPSAPPAGVPPAQESAHTVDGSTIGAASNKSNPAIADLSVTNRLRHELAQLEAEFLALEGVPLDDTRRLAYWPRLAHLNAQLGMKVDALLCRLMVLWELPKQADSMLAEWLQEEKLLERQQEWVNLLRETITKPMPTPGELQLVALTLLVLPRQPQVLQALTPLLPQVSHFLSNHDGTLSVRLAWLAWLALVRVHGADVLSLARTRDRLLERLLNEGLSPERDMPNFLRYHNQNDAQLVRLVQQCLPQLHQEAIRWAASERQGAAVNRPYVDLIFAFAAARLGDHDFSRFLVQQAQTRLAQGDETEQLLLRMFVYRIQQAIAGESTTTLLPEHFRDELGQLSNNTKQQRMCPPRYAAERMLKESRLLDPLDRPDPYRHIRRVYMPQLQAQLAELADEKDPVRLAKRIQSVIQFNPQDPHFAELSHRVLVKTLPLAPRAGETTASRLLTLVSSSLDAAGRLPDSYRDQSELIEQALIVAGHFGKVSMVAELVNRFVELIRAQPPSKRPLAIGSTVGTCLRTLRKFGLRQEVAQLLADFEQLLLQNQPLADAALLYDSKSWVEVLPSLLNVASSWLDLGEFQKAQPIFAEVKRILFVHQFDSSKDRLLPKDYAKIASAYAQALAALPVDQGLQARLEFFNKLDSLPNSQTTASYFSQLHLQVVEAFVCSFASEEMLVGATARRWLEEDEFFVRRRIHRDMQQALAGRL